MEITVHIPDDLAGRLGVDPSRRVLEALAVDEFKRGHLTKREMRRLLGLGRIELDGFLKAHEVFEPYSLADFEREQQSLDRLGL